jgi:uncharacterized protein YdeI (YjbR/CyaY-like superfamily)
MKHYDSVDEFLAEAPRWRSEMKKIRTILKSSGLTESIKWGKPCFSYGSHNVAIVQPMKNFVAVLFTKGALIDDPNERLESQGENTRSAKRLCFVSVAHVKETETSLRDFARQAIVIEEEGKSVPKPKKLALVEELKERLAADSELKAAFEALTPGRQREYHLHISGAKQSKTRAARVEKNVGRILAGKGLRDR